MIEANAQSLEEHRLLRDQIIEFAKNRLHKDVVTLDREHQFDREGFLALGEMGLLGLPIPEAYGGSNAGVVTSMVAMEALGYASKDQGLAFAANTQLWTSALPILKFGTESQRRKYLPKLAEGTLIGGHASTEPEAGSDVFSMRTKAEKRDATWIVNGSKTFVTNGPIADVLIIFASTGESRGFGGGLTAFLVDTDTPGLTRGRPLAKMGLRTAPICELTLEDVRLNEDQILGKKGAGAAIFSSEMEAERSCLFACHLGAMERQLEQVIEHAKNRKQFGSTIGNFQAVSHRIANMKMRIEIARPYLYRVGELKDKNKRATLEASIAKLFVSEAYVQSSLDAVVTLGGYGYMAEYEVERMLRDAVGSMIYSGTSDIQRNIIARWLGVSS